MQPTSAKVCGSISKIKSKKLNLNHEKDNKRAEQYFLLAINRWVRSGVEPTSPPIIEISLKLSNIFKAQKEMDKAYR